MRGGGELATASARLLFLAGFKVAVLEREQPLAVRRLVSFAEALASGEHEVEGVRARSVAETGLAEALQSGDVVPVVVDPDGRQLAALRPQVVVDARMLKCSGDRADHAWLLVGLGPGFVAGVDADAVVETQRGPDLGRVIWSGGAHADSGRPAPIGGVGDARVLRAPCAGRFVARARIGDLVVTLQEVGEIEGVPVHASTAGMLRGLLADGVSVPAGMKVGDIDPRGRAVDPGVVSDKARAVAAGVLEAVTLGLLRRGQQLLASGASR